MSQLNDVIIQLNKTGSISRNWCLQHFNTRLGARINDLKKMGWKFKAQTVKTATGKDFVYTVIEKPEATEIPKPAQTPLSGLNLPSYTNYKNHYDY